MTRKPPPSDHRPSVLRWTTERPDGAALRRDDWHVVAFADLRVRFIESARRVDVRRTSLANPGQPMLDQVDRYDRLAVLDVPVNTLGDLRDVYGFLVEPAYRRGGELLIHASVDIDDLDPAVLVDPGFGYPWTLERLRFVAQRSRLLPARDGRPPMTPIEEILLASMEELGLKPHAQYGIERFRADFAFPEQRLVVECDGRGWHDAQRDDRRDQRLKDLGGRRCASPDHGSCASRAA